HTTTLQEAAGECCRKAQSSVSAEQFLRRVRESHPLLYAGEAQKALHLLRPSDQSELLSRLFSALVRLHQRAETRRVHELQLPQIDHHPLYSRGRYTPEFVLECVARRQVQLSADRDQSRPAIAAHFYAKVILHL